MTADEYLRMTPDDQKRWRTLAKPGDVAELQQALTERFDKIVDRFMKLDANAQGRYLTTAPQLEVDALRDQACARFNAMPVDVRARRVHAMTYSERESWQRAMNVHPTHDGPWHQALKAAAAIEATAGEHHASVARQMHHSAEHARRSGNDDEHERLAKALSDMARAR